MSRYRVLVRPLAIYYTRCTSHDLDDFIYVGAMGLLRAVERFDAHQQENFASFAKLHILGAILDHLRDQAPTIRKPRRQVELEHRVRQLDMDGPAVEVGQRTTPRRSLRRWGSARTHGSGLRPGAKSAG